MASRDPTEHLADLLESAPAEVRRDIIAWLLKAREPSNPGGGWPQLPHSPPGSAPRELANLLYGLSGHLPPTVDSQVVTIRLPATRHAALRDWCNEHGFSMAAVVRGLVERFLEEQARPPTSTG